MSTNVNHEGFERRMVVVKDILSRSGLQATSITPVEYIENGPFPYNNFIYKAALDAPATAASFKSAAHCVVQPPSEGVTSLIVRLSNPRAMGLNNANRVQNEVAAMHLARSGGRFAHLVPAVYAWQAASKKVSAREDCTSGEDVPAEADFGWILMECMPGVPLDEAFRSLQWGEDKMRLVDDVAAIYAAWQSQKLPSGVDRFGGLTFDAGGRIVSGQPTVQEVPAGPWRVYADVWADALRDKLVEADNSSAVQGWKDGGLRDRVDAFVAKVATVLEKAGVEPIRTLVHTDFTMNNMLYNPDTKEISALLDFDWAAATHPAHEFFTSFHDVHGTLGRVESDAMREAVLSGDFSQGQDTESWEIARAWDAAVKKHGGTRPSDIEGIRTLDALNRLADALCPFHLGNEAMIKRMGEEKTKEARAKAEEQVCLLLNHWDA